MIFKNQAQTAAFPEKDPATLAVASPSLHEMHLKLLT